MFYRLICINNYAFVEDISLSKIKYFLLFNHDYIDLGLNF